METVMPLRKATQEIVAESIKGYFEPLVGAYRFVLGISEKQSIKTYVLCLLCTLHSRFHPPCKTDKDASRRASDYQGNIHKDPAPRDGGK
uniref:Uncharacterized protein n=1 Tax=Candidatus Kentrum sp. DK TaxID=2126562 RepID=A0A450SM06_9GAMM|nr:MAG: hypothetical protein BECKDK2373C_GA0170839_104411 [Candidatus Kentron sp. DK]